MKTLILILLVSLISCQTYDYLLFVAEIAGTVCQQYTCTSQYSLNLPQNGVNMHGLWPNYDDGSYPSFCGSLSSDAYSDSKVSSTVLTWLNANWVGLYSDTTSFRNHEWEKHGSCFIEDMPSSKNLRTPNSLDANMNQFFSTVMSIKQSMNLESVLFAQSQWDYSDLQNALSTAFGGISQFNFNCDSSNNLYTINVCIDPSSYSPIDCPSTSGFKYNCSQDNSVYVPQFSI